MLMYGPVFRQNPNINLQFLGGKQLGPCVLMPTSGFAIFSASFSSIHYARIWLLM